ncbi:HesB-like protein [Clostridium sartagoforme]|uniref:HesB-like protein n=1 Tax=Clostridium sartagoforme TaxID=84031 RepID=A0A4S2DMU7_9CLOT|nr:MULTISPECIES: HesB-like protein [Clostridium]MBS5936751.1 HesB-like protein [Clostridium sp.]MDU5110564.1 HesB-like protein [Clostridium sp.]TGY43639.1 HesB-like protein [Clostridium sartagoforme]
MDKIIISEEAYKEFKEFLDENEVDNYSIRINLAGFGCSGPAFNITVDDAKEGDITHKVNDVVFVVEEKLVDEFGGFKLLSTEENEGRGLSLKPIIESESGGCGSCGGGCH